MGKALIVYASRSGETKRIADLIAEGIRIQGSEASVVDATKVKKVDGLEGYDAYIFGSATYHGEMMQAMKTMLFLGDKTGLEGKIGGSFGAFGWSGEAPGRIFDTMKNVLKMNMVSGPLMLKSALLGGGTEMAQGYGKDIAKEL
jgi:NAD(P)H dehydrogenase (quinone)